MRHTFKRVLIANRGEIALRIIRACKELGLETVQVYSEADRHSMAVQEADHAVCIGTARSQDSYLKIPFIVAAALNTQADAIHPGYGFLAENPELARLCAEHNIAFVGPDANVISMMGNKAMARRMAVEANVPTTPGSEDIIHTAEQALDVASKLGYPVILKAAAGGGGRGMRIVHDATEMASQFKNATFEAQACFNDAALYLEKFLTRIRHIEIQVLSDGVNVLHLGERDCSVQRRNQKLLEESPSPVLNQTVRHDMGAAAVRLCQHVGYKNAGTVEFIFDEQSGEFYFMEMNTRIQVEHPVTEAITGIDLVKAQLRIAQGEPLSLTQNDLRFHGHAIECRINAEDPDNDFAPCPGTVSYFHAPGGPGIRIDSHLYSGYSIPPFYDSLLAKIIVWGSSRDEAVDRMKRALTEMRVDGIKTTAGFHQQLLDNSDFLRGNVHTTFVESILREKS